MAFWCRVFGVVCCCVQAGAVEFDPSFWSGVSAEARQCVASMLTVDPLRRPTADQALAHPWFTMATSGGGSGGGGELSAAVAKLRSWRLQKRLKGGAKAVLAMNAFRGGAKAVLAANAFGHANKAASNAGEGDASP